MAWGQASACQCITCRVELCLQVSQTTTAEVASRLNDLQMYQVRA